MKIVECPRDALQGIKTFIPTSEKVRYLNCLLQVGFDSLDFGSFVSPKAIPQMRNTAEVLTQLELENTSTKLLAIVANKRGALQAASHKPIDILGYPFSISETFQLRNTNATIQQSLDRVKEIQEICLLNNKTLLIYISMGFGNPYNDTWSTDIVKYWIAELAILEITMFQLSDTIGVAKATTIEALFSQLIPAYPNLEIGAHFHTTLDTWEEKIEAAFDNGCRRFDGTIMGYGGCPMAQNHLVGNMPSEHLISFAEKRGISTGLDKHQYYKAQQIFNEIIPSLNYSQ